MATSGTLYTGYSRSTRFYLKWSEKSQSTSRNSTTINWSVWLDNGNDWYTNAIKINSVYINGTKVMSSKTFSGFYDNKDYELGSGTLTIAHKDDGTKTFSCSLSGWTYNGDTLTKSGSFTLDKINRYLDSYSNSIGSTALESFNIKWTCSPARDYTQYSLNGGSWTKAGDTVASDNKSGNYTVSGRSPNTTYTIKTRLRRKDSGLYSECSQLSPKTKDYSRISSVTQLTLPAPGSSATLNYSLTKASTNTTNTYLQRNGEGSGSYNVLSNNVNAGNNKFTLSAKVINTIYSQHNTVTAAYNGDANKRATSGISVVAQTIGSKSYYHTYNTTFIMTKDNCGPTAIKDFTCKETNSAIAALTGCTGTYTNGDGLILINGFSGIRFDVPANPLTVRASANNKSVSIAGSSSLTSTSATNYTINHATKNSYSITASDSRNFSLTKSTTGLKLINYTPVNITKLQIDRSGGIGTTAVINFHGNFNNIYFGAVTNTIKKILLKIKTKNLSWNSSSINGGTTIDNSKVNIYDITSFAGIFGPDFDCKNKTITTANGENVIFPLGKEYDISLVVYDELSNIEEFNSSSATQYDSIDSGKVLMSAVKNEGVCFGGFYDSSIGGPLQVAGNTATERLNIGQSLYMDEGDYGIDMNNSDITAINALWFNDDSNAVHEGVNFLKVNGDKANPDDYECLKGYNGYAYYANKKLAFEHPVGSIVITNTNSNPSGALGGTWALVDKEFAPVASTLGGFDANTTNVSSSSIRYSRSGHTINLEIQITPKVKLTDSTIVLGNFDFATLGVTKLNHTIRLLLASDGGQGIVMGEIIYNTGEFRSFDTIPSDISANNNCYINLSFSNYYTQMLDSVCNKFYWKRTA